MYGPDNVCQFVVCVYVVTNQYKSVCWYVLNAHLMSVSWAYMPSLAYGPPKTPLACCVKTMTFEVSSLSFSFPYTLRSNVLCVFSLKCKQ